MIFETARDYKWLNDDISIIIIMANKTVFFFHIRIILWIRNEPRDRERNVTTLEGR